MEKVFRHCRERGRRFYCSEASLEVAARSKVKRSLFGRGWRGSEAPPATFVVGSKKESQEFKQGRLSAPKTGGKRLNLAHNWAESEGINAKGLLLLRLTNDVVAVTSKFVLTGHIRDIHVYCKLL